MFAIVKGRRSEILVGTTRDRPRTSIQNAPVGGADRSLGPCPHERGKGQHVAPWPRRLWAGRESCRGPGGKAPWLTGTFRVIAEGVVSTPP
jgi:hypothetical protein